MTAARTGMPTVDVGAPQLAMHSARELMGAADVGAYAAALAAFLTPDG
ncbi:M18 family aminopeptidase 2 [Mycobacteroides abscessus subsp. abscessus]|nr:M18 family aminopeptidase 2 [Mycobacteroides abscessus subsp. abscessus]